MSALAIVAVSVAYALVGLVVACRIATLNAYRLLREHNSRSYNRNDQREDPNGEHWFGGACFGFLAAVVWPLVILASAFRGVLFAPPRDVQLDRQAKRIAELEEKLEIR